jgi:hypothetical protein
MFVHRTHGVVAATLGVLGLSACTDPIQNTDLRPEGDPEVLAVLVLTDAASHLVEKATFCKTGDEKRPSLVGLPDFTTQQVCPENMSEQAPEVSDAYPDGWYVRIMFDELLDASVEELVEVFDEDTGESTGTFTGTVANTRPVLLQCESVTNGQMTNVAYDGYYSPSGNRVTWPLGPSLVIKPADASLIATNTNCQITLNDVVNDKSGNPVPMAQRGPYKFKVAPIKVIAIDPPDDPDYEAPIFARQIYFDNPFIQFNTFVDLDTLCPDSDGDGLCDSEQTFSIKDNEHPDVGPGYCNDTAGTTCGTLADCPTGATVCGRGFCGADGKPCNAPTDCATANDTCGTLYAYDYLTLGLTDTEYGIGPPEPLQVERKYTMQFTTGAKLKDRCGKESTLPAPNKDDFTLVHFVTDKYDLDKTSIVTGETASANKRLQWNFTNVVEGSDYTSATGATAYVQAVSPAIAPASYTLTSSGQMPKVLTGACTGTAPCPLADLPLDELFIVPIDASGQIQAQGHYAINTEYTFTLKAGTIIKDFYGKEWNSGTTDRVIKWKTDAAIKVTGLALRVTGTLISIGDEGTAVKTTPTTTLDLRIGFNASIDPTTLAAEDYTIEPAPMGTVTYSPSGCGRFSAIDLQNPTSANAADNRTGYLSTCTLRVRALFAVGDYKFTLKKGAQFKDIFGTEYTQEEDEVLTFTVEEAKAPIQCH